MTDHQTENARETEAREDMPAPQPPPDENRGVAYYQFIATTLARAAEPGPTGWHIRYARLAELDNGLVRDFLRQQTE